MKHKQQKIIVEDEEAFTGILNTQQTRNSNSSNKQFHKDVAERIK